MELGGDREFVYRPIWWFVYGMAAGVVGYAGIGATLLVSALGDWRAQHGSTAAYGAFVDPLLLLLLAVLSAAIIRDEVAKVRRGLVSVTRAGIAVRDRRGREQRLLWPDVQELRVMPCLGLDALDIRGTGRRLKVEFGLQDREDLCDLIIARAGLTEKTHKWWGVVYRRPAG